MSAGERVPLPTGGNGLLRGSRTRSYGSLVNSSLSPVRQKRIEHLIQPGETLQGIALKYGVSMEQIKRANRLYTNDSIFLKRSLSIPVLSDFDANNGASCVEERLGDRAPNGSSPSHSVTEGMNDEISELSPLDYLKRMDTIIDQSKQAAVKGRQESETRFAALEAACTSGTPERCRLTRSQSAFSCPRMHQQATLGIVPLTITKRTKNLREREDEIFEL